MAEKDQISRGIVRRVMHYGAIVQLDCGVTGLVHISEIANSYVNDVNHYCIEGAPVVVQVLCQKEDGRWEFSMKKALNNETARALIEQVSAEVAEGAFPENSESPTQTSANFGAGQPMYDGAAPHQMVLRPSGNPKKRAEFDEKLRDFLTDSSDHIEDVKRHHENRLGGRRR